MRLISAKSQRFDEVPPLIAHEACAAQTVKGVDLKRVPPKSLIRPPFDKISPVEEAARKDSAVHVSLSSDLLFKQPGTDESPLPGEPESRRSKTSDKAGCLPTEKSCGASEARHRADLRQRAEELIYTGSRVRLSTTSENEKSQLGIRPDRPVTQYLMCFSRIARCRDRKNYTPQ
jgi:hypothetical protein